jgi:hypothetical protein
MLAFPILRLGWMYKCGYDHHFGKRHGRGVEVDEGEERLKIGDEAR